LEQTVPDGGHARGREQARASRTYFGDGSSYGPEGTIYFADRQVNQSTGAIRIAGLFRILEIFCAPAGMAKVRAAVRVQQDALLYLSAQSRSCKVLSSRALDNENKVSIRAVKWATGRRPVDYRDGLKRGERVVVEVCKRYVQACSHPKPFAVESQGR